MVDMWTTAWILGMGVIQGVPFFMTGISDTLHLKGSILQANFPPSLASLISCATTSGTRGCCLVSKPQAPLSLPFRYTMLLYLSGAKTPLFCRGETESKKRKGPHSNSKYPIKQQQEPGKLTEGVPSASSQDTSVQQSLVSVHRQECISSTHSY